MVVSVPSKKAQALYAIATVVVMAMMVVAGSPLLLEYMAASSGPDWVYWVAAGFVVLGAVPTYWALLPIGAAQALRSTGSVQLEQHARAVGGWATGCRGSMEREKSMIKIVIGLVVAAWLVVSVVSWDKEDTRQAQRNTEQGQLLADLESLNTPAVSKLVDEWRVTYPAPTEERLTELRVLAQRVKADPAGAAKFTAAQRQKKYDDLPFSSPLGSPKAKPGING